MLAGPVRDAYGKDDGLPALVVTQPGRAIRFGLAALRQDDGAAHLVARSVARPNVMDGSLK
jgi:hypothetical protein